MTASDAGTSSFTELGLNSLLLETLNGLNYEAPTPVQARTIPALLQGRDLIGQAQTGSGKTAAFSLPMLHNIEPDGHVRGLILTPTRELALQVADALESYAKKLKVRIAAVYGGAPIDVQFRALKRGADIVVGTPGRIIDHLERGSLKLDQVQMAVLDEADQMLKMGFIEDVEHILSHIPETSQRVLFSATMPGPIHRIARRSLRDPVNIEIETSDETAPSIQQRVIRVRDADKMRTLCGLLEVADFEAAIIFARTQVRCTEVAEQLVSLGFPSEGLHGGMNQNMRERVVQRLRSGQLRIIVATDVAARGIDVESITHVINLDIPFDVESYVHRIGRTGRAGREGTSYLFVTPSERRLLMSIERYTGQQIDVVDPPSNKDVAMARARSFFRALAGQTEDDKGLAFYEGLFNQWAEELEVDAARLGAVLIRMAAGDRSLEPAPEPPVRSRRLEQRDSMPRDDFRERAPRGGRGRDDAGDGPAHITHEPGMVRLFLGTGRRNQTTPSMIVGALANGAGIDGRDIGRIEIQDRATFVDVKAEVAEAVITMETVAMGHRMVPITLARPDSGDRSGDAGGPAGRRKPGFGPPKGRSAKGGFGPPGPRRGPPKKR